MPLIAILKNKIILRFIHYSRKSAKNFRDDCSSDLKNLRFFLQILIWLWMENQCNIEKLFAMKKLDTNTHHYSPSAPSQTCVGGRRHGQWETVYKDEIRSMHHSSLISDQAGWSSRFFSEISLCISKMTKLTKTGALFFIYFTFFQLTPG